MALGGVLQSHGADWTNGTVHIDAGGSHESNPYEGIQIGKDASGTPNLVEEGERIFNDYVYSKRIFADGGTLEKFHLSKKRKISFADLAELLEKESKERPNDPISQAGLKAQMSQLADEQERQKAEMEAARAREAFEALSPEEQTAVMQNAAQQEAMAQQAAQEQAIAQQQAMQQPSPEEAAMMQQQMMQADGSQAMVGQQAPMMAYGGKVNRYADGGLKKKVYSLLGITTDKDFNSWLDKKGDEYLDKEAVMKALENDDYNALIKNSAFVRTLRNENRGLAHSVSSGNNFGMFTPDASGATFTDPDKGNWDRQMFEGWNGSKDAAWEELVDKYGIDRLKGIEKREDLEKIFKETNAYKNTTKWLQSNPENMRKYLKSVLDTSSSSRAKKHALQFVNEDGTWKDANKIPTYAQIFGENGKGVRETHPGTYWHSVVEANRGTQAKNWVINDDGSIDEIKGDVPTDWTGAGNYSWATPENDFTYNYYRRPAAATTPEEAKTPEQKAIEEEKKIVPDLRKETSFGMLGPGIGLGLMATGLGKPDNALLDSAVSGAGTAHLANYQPIGNYLTYRPLDRMFYANQLNGQSLATERMLMNTNSPSRAANLLAHAYNTMLANGNLYRQGEEYNDNLEKQVEDFNRGTDMFNAQAYNQNQQFNASALNNVASDAMRMKLGAAQAKLDNDKWWASNLYGNINGLFDNINQWEKWKRDHNTVAKMYANGLAGTITEKNPVGIGMVKSVDAKGGKLKKKKRGLTI